MCEPAQPIDTLKRIRFSLSAVSDALPAGSSERERVALMCEGIRDRLDWCIANLERAGEGRSNFGLDKYPGARGGKDGG